MKKYLKQVFSLLLALIVTIPVMSVPVRAENGPCLEEDYPFAFITLGDTVVFSATEANDVAGVAYDKGSNTLTLTNYNQPGTVLSTNMMGDDFKLNLVGDNHLAAIAVWGDGWGGSLNICGNGNLTVNETKSQQYGVNLVAEHTSSVLKVESSCNVVIYGGNGGSPFSSSYNLTANPIVAKGNVTDLALETSHPFQPTEVYGGYFDPSIAPDTSSIYTKAGDDGLYIITTITDMAGNTSYRIAKLQSCEGLGADLAVTVADNATDVSEYTMTTQNATYYPTSSISGGPYYLVKKTATGEAYIYDRSYYENGATYTALFPVLTSFMDVEIQQTRYLMDINYPVSKTEKSLFATIDEALPDGYELQGTNVEGVYNFVSSASALTFTAVASPVEIKDGVVDVSGGNTTISAESFQQILEANKNSDITIKSNNGITFTFGKGTMSAVANVTNYDFSVVLTQKYGELGALPSAVSQNIFVGEIRYNYSGQLPAEAQIRIPVGVAYAGQTLYYSQLLDDGTIRNIMSAVVDAEGYLTIKQNHCSTYLITKEKLPETAGKDAATGTNQATAKAPKTGDSSMILFFTILLIGSMGAGIISIKKKNSYR